MNVLTIGMLAHNEALGIRRTIASLAAQSIFKPERAGELGLKRVDVIVVPNGCSDDTAAVAREALAALMPGIPASVRELAQPGKANAWNVFVHDLSPSDATILALMDADIEFGTPDTLERIIARLDAAPRCDVATDRAVKDYRGKRRTIFNRASRRVSEQQAGEAGLCGQLYCGRAEVLRRIWLPAGLPVEDGFIAAMLVTHGFTRPDDAAAIGYASGAWHWFEPLTGPASFTRHEARIIVGSVINAWLFALMWEAGKTGHAGAYVRRRNEEDPAWVDRVCDVAKRDRGRWLVPPWFIWWRLTPLKGQGPRGIAIRGPLALAATAASMPAVLRANAILRRPSASRHW